MWSGAERDRVRLRIGQLPSGALSDQKTRGSTDADTPLRWPDRGNRLLGTSRWACRDTKTDGWPLCPFPVAGLFMRVQFTRLRPDVDRCRLNPQASVFLRSVFECQFDAN